MAFNEFGSQSCQSTLRPSRVTETSTSTALAPSSSAEANEARVFSTWCTGDPRWPITQKGGLTETEIGTLEKVGEWRFGPKNVRR